MVLRENTLKFNSNLNTRGLLVVNSLMSSMLVIFVNPSWVIHSLVVSLFMIKTYDADEIVYEFVL